MLKSSTQNIRIHQSHGKFFYAPKGNAWPTYLDPPAHFKTPPSDAIVSDHYYLSRVSRIDKSRKNTYEKFADNYQGLFFSGDNLNVSLDLSCREK